MSGIRRTSTALAAACALSLVLAACAPSAAPENVPASSGPRPSPSPSPTMPLLSSPAASWDDTVVLQPSGSVHDVASALSVPWSVVFVDGSALVSSRDDGRVREITSAGAVRDVGVIADAVHRGEGGLLGLAIGPDGQLYAYETTVDGNQVQAFVLTGTAGSFGLGAVRTVIEGLPSAANHNGGRIAFGPDGELYIGVGDAGNPDAAQRLDDLGGKILRVSPDGTIPADNPFPGSPVYSLGHRNPQGLAWAADGTMFASEFGQDTWDELNIIRPSANYGWPLHEGIAGAPGFVDPVQQWAPGEASPSGIAIVGGTIFIANLRGRLLRAVPVSAPESSTEYFVGEFGRLRAAVAAPDGSLWLVTNNTDGRGDAQPGDDRIIRVALAPVT